MPTASEPNSLRPASMLVALAAYAACAGLFIAANPWEPLSGGLGVCILLGGSLALGLIGGRWQTLLAALVLIPLVPLSRAPEPAIVAVSLPFVLGACAALIALGVGLRALARRRGVRTGARARVIGVALLTLAGALAAWGVYLANRVVDHSPAHPVLVDERAATYRGLALGAPAADIRHRFGKRAPDRGFTASPVGVDPADVSGPGSIPDWHSWRYRDLVVFTHGGRVRGFLTTDPDAQTREGVGVGDSLAVATGAYANLRCMGVTLGSDATNPQYRACEGRLPGGATIWLGGDPIDSIWVTETYGQRPGPPIRAR